MTQIALAWSAGALAAWLASQSGNVIGIGPCHQQQHGTLTRPLSG